MFYPERCSGGPRPPENRVRPLETCDHRTTNTRLALPKVIFRPLGISNRPSGEKILDKILCKFQKLLSYKKGNYHHITKKFQGQTVPTPFIINQLSIFFSKTDLLDFRLRSIKYIDYCHLFSKELYYESLLFIRE